MFQRSTSLVLVLGFLAALVSPTAAGARPARQMAPGETTISLPAGGEMSLPVSAFCINFGEPFPKAVTVSTDRTSDGVVKVLKAAAKDGTATNTLQTQIAVWHALEGKWGYKDADVDMTVARAIDAAATGETTQPLMGRGVALDQAIKAGQVQATVSDWKPVDAPKALPTDSPYYGTGTLVVKNLSNEKLELYVPLGVVLKAANAAEQDMAMYAVSNYDTTPKALPTTGAEDVPWPAFLAVVGLIMVFLGLVRRRRVNALKA